MRKRSFLTQAIRALSAEDFYNASESTKSCATGVFLISLFSCNFNDQLSYNFHSFVILHTKLDYLSLTNNKLVQCLLLNGADTGFTWGIGATSHKRNNEVNYPPLFWVMCNRITFTWNTQNKGHKVHFMPHRKDEAIMVNGKLHHW